MPVPIKRVGRGRPRLRPQRLASNKGYDSAALRTAVRRRGIEPIIPSRSNRIRVITFDRARYRERNVIERCINRLKQWRRVATRYEKLCRQLRRRDPQCSNHAICEPTTLKTRLVT